MRKEKILIITKHRWKNSFENIKKYFESIDVCNKIELCHKDKYDLILLDYKFINYYDEIKKNSEVFIILNKVSNKKLKKLIDKKIEHYIVQPIDKSQIDYIISVLEKDQYINKLIDNNFILNEYREKLNKELIVSKTDKKGIITFVNDNFCKISEYKRSELIGKPHNIVRHPDNPKSIYKDMWYTIKKKKDNWHGIIKNRSKSGRNYFTYSIIIPILDKNNKIKEYVSIRYDITNIMNQSKQLYQSVNDMDNPILIYIKLDNIDIIEQYYDNGISERFQEEVLHYLHEKFNTICQIEKVYQLNHGEYALLAENRNNCFNNDSIKYIKNLQNELFNENIEIDKLRFNIPILVSIVTEKDKMIESAKIGIKKLIKNKEYFIIANGLANIKKQEAQYNMEVITSISDALKNNRIKIFLQPIVDNKQGKVAKYEALVRMLDNEGNVIPPNIFLELSKKSNYYPLITKRVMDLAIEHIRKYNIDISVNISALDIEQDSSRNILLDIIDENSDIAHKLTFELLEDESVTNFEIINLFISTVKKYGVSIAIDDFGTGYSNYERLVHYQPDILKIDGSLIKNIFKDDFILSIIKSIVTFAKEKNIKTVAEFIEDENLYNSVKLLGIDYSQGYLFGKPLIYNDNNS